MTQTQYRVTACLPMDDGRVMGLDQAEVLGEAYGRTYASRDEAETMAQECQDSLEDYDLDLSTEYGVEECEVEILARCQSGEWSREACAWQGDADTLSSVEFVPDQHRDTVQAAGTWAGLARVIRVCPECVEQMLGYDADWCEVRT